MGSEMCIRDSPRVLQCFFLAFLHFPCVLRRFWMCAGPFPHVLHTFWQLVCIFLVFYSGLRGLGFKLSKPKPNKPQIHCTASLFVAFRDFHIFFGVFASTSKPARVDGTRLRDTNPAARSRKRSNRFKNGPKSKPFMDSFFD